MKLEVAQKQMTGQEQIFFDNFRLDIRNEILYRGEEIIPLRPKAYDLLRYLVQRPSQLIGKKEILDAIWPECHVGDCVLKQGVAEIRKILGDEAKKPRFIETAHRRGYRFIGEVKSPDLADSGQLANDDKNKIPARRLKDFQLVGRDSELAELNYLLEKALAGERQVVVVAGEQGIGKTALVNAFLDGDFFHRAPGSNSKVGKFQDQVLVARGQCIEIRGSGESYMPLFEALNWLARKGIRSQLVTVLSKYAPLWLLQMPSLVRAGKLEKLQRATFGATRKRMLREIVEALEALTTDMALILVLEDLHWSDQSTLNFISYLAQRPAPARLLVIGTYRSLEVTHKGRSIISLKQELQVRGQCRELLLEPLDETALTEYLTMRFPGNRFPSGISAWIHRRTEGNPLFMVNLIDHMVGQKSIVHENGYWTLTVDLEEAEIDVPGTIQAMIENKVQRCSPQEQEVLGAGSVEGVEFSKSVLAEVLDRQVAWIEAICEGLARRHLFIQSEFVQPISDKGSITCYRFIHELYQKILYRRLQQTRRRELHRRLGKYLERVNSENLEMHAARLAVHFEKGEELDSAIKYYQLAADAALRRFAEDEAAQLARLGLRLIDRAQQTPECALQELELQIVLGKALASTQGFGAVEAKDAFDRAQELCRQSGAITPLFSAFLGLWRGCGIRAESERARDLGTELLQLANMEQDPIMLNEAYCAVGNNMMAQGEFASALEYFEKGIAFGNLQEKDTDRYLYGRDPSISSHCGAALANWELGFPDRGLHNIIEALALTREDRYPEGYVFAHIFAAHLHRRRRESTKSLNQIKMALACAHQRGLVHWIASGSSIYGWALAKQGFVNDGKEKIRQALDAQRAIGSEHSRSMTTAMLAEVLMDSGEVEEALVTVEEALNAVLRTGVCNCEAEIYLLKGRLLLRKLGIEQGLEQAETCFRRSIEVARRQQAKSVELRGTIAIARLWQKLNRHVEAYRALTEIYNWFTEGHDTTDLKEAQALIEQLGKKSKGPANPARMKGSESLPAL